MSLSQCRTMIKCCAPAPAGPRSSRIFADGIRAAIWIASFRSFASIGVAAAELLLRLGERPVGRGHAGRSGRGRSSRSSTGAAGRCRPGSGRSGWMPLGEGDNTPPMQRLPSLFGMVLELLLFVVNQAQILHGTLALRPLVARGPAKSTSAGLLLRDIYVDIGRWRPRIRPS